MPEILIEPPPAWLTVTYCRVMGLPIDRTQTRAAFQLLRGLEFNDLPVPRIDLMEVVRPGTTSVRTVACLSWFCRTNNLGRGVIVLPVSFTGVLQAEVYLRFRGCVLWNGWPDAPVPALRGILKWVYLQE